jgi:anti-anti-sigma factor
MRHWDRTRKDGPLTVQVEQMGDRLIVRAVGELSHSTAKTFEAELRMVISGGAPAVELDLGEVGFIDSVGLRSVIRAGNQSARVGGQLRIRRASAPVQRASEWADVQRVVPWSDEASAAVSKVPRALPHDDAAAASPPVLRAVMTT